MVDAQSIKEAISELLNQPLSKLGDEALLTDLVTESLLLVETVIELQERFGVRLVQEDLKGVRTIGDLTALFQSRAR